MCQAVNLHDLIYYSQSTCGKGVVIPILPLKELRLREGHVLVITQCALRRPPQLVSRTSSVLSAGLWRAGTNVGSRP